MRGPSSWAVAVRRPDGRISEVSHDVTSVAVRRRWLRLPVVRGVVALGESLAIGIRALAVSADYAATDEGEEDASEELSTLATWWPRSCSRSGSRSVLFKVSPRAAHRTFGLQPAHLVVRADRGRHPRRHAGRLPGADLAGSRAAARLPVPRRRAQGDQRLRGRRDADARGRAAPQPHPRPLRHRVPALGDGHRDPRLRRARRASPSSTSVAASSRASSRCLPIAGLAYEVIRLAGEHGRYPLVRAVLAPGLWLQRLTTREPTLDQVAVSIRALERVLAAEEERTVARRRARRGHGLGAAWTPRRCAHCRRRSSSSTATSRTPRSSR